MAIDLVTLVRRAWLPKRRRGFVRDESGVTAVEFGILALPFFSILGALLETSVIFLSSQMLYSAVQDSSRLIRTGQAQESGMTLTGFRDNICDRLFGLFDCNGLFVEVQVAGNFNSTSMSPPVDFDCTGTACDGWTRDPVFSPGQGSSFMTVQVYYKWPVVINLGNIAWANLPTGERVMAGTAVFRNEPFS